MEDLFWYLDPISVSILTVVLLMLLQGVTTYFFIDVALLSFQSMGLLE